MKKLTELANDSAKTDTAKAQAEVFKQELNSLVSKHANDGNWDQISQVVKGIEKPTVNENKDASGTTIVTAGEKSKALKDARSLQEFLHKAKVKNEGTEIGNKLSEKLTDFISELEADLY